MKSLIIRAAVLAAAFVTPHAVSAELETEQEKLGYMIGMYWGRTLASQDAEVDLDALFDAIRTVYEGGEPLMSDAEAQALSQAFREQREAAAAAEQKALASKNKAEAEAFLARNATADGVQVTDSGLQYQVLEAGDGARPAATDTVTVHYRGTLLDGTEFDSSYNRGEPVSFALNRVIPGWTEGVQLMPVGSKYKFWIKPELGYGESGGGPIPPNSALVFEVELISIGG